MNAGPLQRLMRNDLRAVAVFMVFMFVLIPGLELQDTETPGAPGSLTPPTGGHNQTQTLKTGEVLSRSGYTNEGQSTEEKFGLGYPLVTNVKAELKWTDDYGSNDVFSIELKREGQSVDKQQGTTGDLTVQATAKAGENLAGNFTVIITCVSAPGVVGPSPINRDNGNSWDMKVTATYSEEVGP